MNRQSPEFADELDAGPERVGMNQGRLNLLSQRTCPTCQTLSWTMNTTNKIPTFMKDFDSGKKTDHKKCKYSICWAHWVVVEHYEQNQNKDRECQA